jgi:hypothetical protein
MAPAAVGAAVAESFFPIPPDLLVRAGIHSINAFGALFLVVVCGNVALLMFARAATRAEILVRGLRCRPQPDRHAVHRSARAGCHCGGARLDRNGLRVEMDPGRVEREAEGWPFWLEGGVSATTVNDRSCHTPRGGRRRRGPALKITRRKLRPVSVSRAPAQASEWVI